MNKYIDMRVFSMQNGGIWGQKVHQELERRLHNEATYCFPFSINNHQAFVVLCKELLQTISAINQKHLKLVNLCHQIPREARAHFAISSMLEEIQQSNEYENVHSTRREIWDAIEELHIEHSDKRFNGMVRKYNLLIAGKDIPLRSSSDIRRLYDEFIFDEVVRENPNNAPDGIIFRKEPAHVVSKHDQIVHTGIIPESKIIEKMDQALTLLNDTEIDPLIRIAAFHYMFGYIHPFYDGNGRMTRFISSYMLSKVYENSACLRIAYVIKDHRNVYQQIFRDTNDERALGDMTRFVIEFLRFFEKAIDDTCTSLDRRFRDYQYYKLLLDHVVNTHLPELSKYEKMLRKMLVIELFGYSSLDIQQLTVHSGYSANTVRKVLNMCGNYVWHSEDGKKHLWHISLQALNNVASEITEKQNAE